MCILIAGGLFRLAYLVEFSHTPRMDFPSLDEAFNDYWARSVATGAWPSAEHPAGPRIRSMPFFKAPGYPYFLSTIYKITGSRALLARLAQGLLGMMSCLLLFYLGRGLFSPPVGLLAAAGMAFYWIFPYYEMTLHAPVLVVFLLLLIFSLLHHWHDRWSPRRLLLFGLLLGLSGLVRKNLFLLAPILAAWFWLQLESRRRLRGILLFLLAAALPILPVSVRNLRASGEWVPISCDVGRNLYIANNPFADGVHPILPEQEILTGRGGWSLFSYPELVDALSQYMGRPMSCSETERFFAKRAVRFMLDHPGRVLRLTARKVLLFLGPREVSSDRVVHYDRLHSRVLRLLPGNFALLLVGATLGALLLWRDRSRQPIPPLILLMGLSLAVYALSFLPGLPESRYRVGLLPFFILLGSYALVDIGRRFLQPNGYRSGLAWLPAGLVVYGLASLNVTGYQPDKAKWHYENAVALEAAGDVAAAARQYAAAIQTRPNFVEAHNNIATTFTTLGDTERAERHLRYAIQLRPTYFKPHENLVALLLREKRYDDALAAAEYAMKCRPEDYRAFHLLGLVLSAEGHFAGALPYYERALKMQPRDPIVHNNFGMALARMQRFDEARREFNAALALRPDYRDAQENLGALKSRSTFNPITPGQ